MLFKFNVCTVLSVAFTKNSFMWKSTLLHIEIIDVVPVIT